MSKAQAEDLLAELDRENAATRRILAAVPFDDPEWKPHEKSMSLAHLAGHVATNPGWGTTVLTTDELDFESEEMKSYEPEMPASSEALLALFDENAGTFRAKLAETDDATLDGDWTMRAGDHHIGTMPRKEAIRVWVLSHSIHHRGQLSVYLRLLDVPVPQVYGPTADDQAM